jgi:hypothetical protein
MLASPGQYFNISSQYQYQPKTDYTIITILNSQYIEYSIYRLSTFCRVSADAHLHFQYKNSC